MRIVAIPLIVGVYFPRALPYGIDRDILATVLFVAAALTDWLDGWLARRWQQTSSFGAFLDPVADKLMVAAALLVLLDLSRVNALVALVIIGREITISALREWMAQIGASRSVAVHWLGKVKTIAQMVAIPMLLFNNVFLSIDTARLGTWLIYVAAVLTVWSMLYYMRKAYPQIVLRTRSRDRLRRANKAARDVPAAAIPPSASKPAPKPTANPTPRAEPGK
jgi:CDP-diacylglycerol--glycerol-3-phosphate 3-phosphatidyltransferase